MIIRRLRLRNFKKFRDTTLEFTPGFNVVKGPNEAGKSTLHAALRMALFEKPTATAKEIKAAKSWGAEQMFTLGLDFQADGEDYALEKDFAARKVALSGGQLRDAVGDPDSVQARLCAWLGCPTKEFFDSTTCIAHDEIAGLETKEMADRLQAVVGGGDVGAREVLKDLNAALAKLKKGLDKHAYSPGPIRAAQVELADVRRRRDELKGRIARVRDAKTAASEAAAGLQSLQEDLDASVGLVDKNKRILALEAELARLKSEHERRQKARELKTEITELVEQEETFARLAAVERQVAELPARSARLDANTQTLARLRAEEGAPPPRRSSIAIATVGLVVLLAGLAAGYTMTPGIYVVALAGLALLIFSLVTMRSPGAPRIAPGEEAEQARLQSEIEAESAKIAALLGEAGAVSVDEAEARLASLRDLRARCSAKESELRGVSGGMSWEDFERETSALGSDIEQKKDALRELAPSRLEPAEFERHVADVERLRQRKAGLEKKRDEAGYEIEHADANADELAQLEDRAAELEEHLELWQRRRAVYEATIEGVAQAEAETMRQATDVLRDSVSAHIGRITDGRYREVLVDEADLQIRVRSDEKGDWVSVGVATQRGRDENELSRATRDQFYLAARLGLIAHLCGEAMPPLLLDDPFVTFDEERRERTLSLLKELSAERQILLFSCHDGYERFADKVIDLGAGCGEATA